MIKNLVFSGGGTRIYSFIGVLRLLEEKNMLNNIENIIGTSSGSIIALFLCLDFTVSEIEEILLNINAESLKTIDPNNILNFFNDYGIDDAKNIKKIMKIIFKVKLKKENVTFKELFDITKKNLVICATCLNKNECIYFNHIDYPDLFVNDAIIMSISVPILFKPIKFEDNYYVDGGLTNHYPINYFNDRKNTLGILICNDLSYFNINNIEDYIYSVLFCSMNKLTKDNHNLYKENTIYLKLNGDFLNFDLTLEKKKELINIGYNISAEFINNYINDNTLEENNENNNKDDNILDENSSSKEKNDNNLDNENDLDENNENDLDENDNIIL